MDVLSYKEYRRYLLLNLIHALGPISRTRLADITDYRLAAVGEIVGELLEENLLTESGSTCVGQGRRRTLLKLNTEYLSAIGISVNGAAVIIKMLTIDGRVLKEVSHPLVELGSAQRLQQEVVSTVQQFLEEFGDRKIFGIGICDSGDAPGTVILGEQYAFSFERFVSWVREELREVLEQTCGLPVVVYGRGTLISVADEKFGAARGLRDFVSLDLCNGIGMSFYCNGMVVAGSSGQAGQLGHMRVSENGTICHCGKPGCVEKLAMFPAIKKKILDELEKGAYSALRAFYDGSRELSVEDVRRALDAGDRLCNHFVRESAEMLGLATANVVNVLDPQAVIFHGYMLGLGERFTAPLIESAWENIMPCFSHVEIRLMEDSLEDMLPMGAAAMMLARFLKTDDFQWVYHLETEHSDM